MATVFSNIKTFQASKGQTVQVTLDTSEVALMDEINVGDPCQVDSSGNVGYVSRIDRMGHTIWVTPNMPIADMSSTSPIGYLEDGDPLTVNP